jgi:arylsulfatase A-like enzyme
MKSAGLFSIALAGVLALNSGSASGTRPSARPSWQTTERKPNIVFIYADDMGYGDPGCYGQQLIKTPNLDRMAREGMRFTNGYCPQAVCSPSRCGLLTGFNMGHSYIRKNTSPPPETPLRPEDKTVAEVLKTAGYRTGMVGKWGLGNQSSTGCPKRKGFDYSVAELDANENGYYPAHVWKNNKKIDVPTGTYSQDLYTSEAVDFIKRERDNPFFLYVAFPAPHAPYVPPSDFPYSGESWSSEDRNFAATITHLDSDVGKIFAALNDAGIDQHTILFFSSDNGPEGPNMFDSVGPFNGLKRTLYEGGIRVPLIARWPGTVPRGVSDEPVALWDFLPTAAELAGAEVPSGIDGISIVNLLLGQTQHVHESLYWEMMVKNGKGFMQAVRLGSWKGLQFSSGKKKRRVVTFELYDLESDIGEEHNVAGLNPEVVERMRQIMIEEHTPPLVNSVPRR